VCPIRRESRKSESTIRTITKSVLDGVRSAVGDAEWIEKEDGAGGLKVFAGSLTPQSRIWKWEWLRKTRNYLLKWVRGMVNVSGGCL